MPKPEQTQLVSCKITQETWKMFKICCVFLGENQQDVMDRIVREFIDKQRTRLNVFVYEKGKGGKE